MGLGGLLARLTAIFLVLALLTYGAGFLLPRERTIVSQSVLSATPERVFAVVTDVKGQAAWRDDAPIIDVVEGSKPPSWSETSSGKQTTFREVTREHPKRYEIEFESSDGIQGRRTYVFEATGSGLRTSLTRTEVLQIANPFRRVQSYLMMNLQSVVDAQSEDLGRVFMKESLDAQPTGTPPESAPGLGGAPEPSPTAPPAATTPTATGLIPTGPIPTGTIPAGSIPAGSIPAGPIPAGPIPTAPMPTGPIPTGPSIPGALPTVTPSASPSPTPARI
jgi:hypothetical protein